MILNSSRPANLERGRALQQEAQTKLQPLNNELSEFSSHEAVVMFAIDNKLRSASTLATVETNSPIDIERHRMRRYNVDKRFIDLAATAFGASLNELRSRKFEKSWCEESHMNPGVHMTWTPRPIIDNEVAIAAPQLAFNMHYGNFPGQDLLERIYRAHEPVIEEIAHAFQDFKNESGPLHKTLELKRPKTPNSFVIRWDLKGSTGLATDELEPILSNYLDDLKENVSGAIDGLISSTIDAGDGQNIIVDIPSSYDLADPKVIKRYYNDSIQPIIDDIISKHNKLSIIYPELHSPGLSLEVGSGYVSRDGGQLHNIVLWRIADKLKKQDS
ncbi:MAG TPA: hypothetical protein PK265_01190 [Candidatus Saccharibacteria bacterium]|nr:hypothetical protein [Candidatus Saccharibacteria bacterium]HRQ97926.1 hypothetical protein [Candidatus Saccharibacteria bacterium]